ncbi:unnamed protein product [Tenebrio molitor]|nr:unnamed protein product [Tenebrio molitor]
MLLYCILQVQIQIFLVNEQILQISDNFTDFDNLDIIDELSYQNTIHQRLSQDCRQHYEIKRCLVNVIFHLTNNILTYRLITKPFPYINCSFKFILKVGAFEAASIIWKLRLSMLNVFVTMIAFTISQAGQNLFDETSGTFDILTQCSWYNWNAKNKQILLIFMTNCLKPFSLTFAGIIINYNLTLFILRNGCSYALVLYNLQNFN